MHEYLFVEPVDVLYFRGNRLFGEAGEHAEAQMPPSPSVFAGALRTRILVDRRASFEAFKEARTGDRHIEVVLGTPSRPGTFRMGHVILAKREQDGLKCFFPVPADLVVSKSDGRIKICRLEPESGQNLSPVDLCSQDVGFVPVLRTDEPAKSEEGYWLTEEGLRVHLAGGSPDPRIGHLRDTRHLWKSDARLGIALQPGTRTAEEGRLYTTDAVAPLPGVGFLVRVAEAADLLPQDGLLRLGGDGRGATVRAWEPSASLQDVWRYLPKGDGFRMILSTPGIFPDGWIPAGVRRDGSRLVLEFGELRCEICAASVRRFQVVSGWDVAEERPKPAQRVVPPGSVYWFRRLSGDPMLLLRLLDEGLWPLFGPRNEQTLWQQRRAEGFNNIILGDWSTGGPTD